MRRKIGKIITPIVLLTAVLAICFYPLVKPVFARTIGLVSDKLGVFTGPDSGTEQDDNVKASLDLLHNKVGPVLSKGTGTLYFVDSGAAAGGETGLDWTNAKLTIKAGADLCTASRGDHVMVAAGHAENLSGADGVDLDLPGVRVWGLGEGDNRPTLTYTNANGEFVFGAAGVTVENIRFLAGVDAVTMGISFEAGADNCTLRNCDFPEPTSSVYDFVDAIDVAAGVDDLTVENCVYYHASATGPAHFIEAGNGVNQRMNIVNNRIYGEFSVAAIWSDTIDIDNYIAGNVIMQETADQHGIEFTAAATGVLKDNMVYSNSPSSSYDPGSMYMTGNKHSVGIDQAAYEWPFDGKRRLLKSNWTAADNGTAIQTTAIFTVTGDIQGYLYGVCNVAPGPYTNTSAIGVGTAQGTNTILDALGMQTSPPSSLAANEIWHDSSPTTQIEQVDVLSTREFILTNGQDINFYVVSAVQDTEGDIDFYFYWLPLSADAMVTVPSYGK